MKELQRRQYLKRLTYSIPALALFALLGFLIAKGAYGVVMKERESASRVDELEQKALVLSSRQQELEKAIERLKTEEGIVEEIREKFPVTRGDEHIAIIVDDRYGATSTVVSGEPWYEKLWNAIIGE